MAVGKTAQATATLRLGHVNIRARSLAVTVGWYERTLGLRPVTADTNPDPAQNLWLCDASGHACIHVNQLAPGDVRAAQGHIDHFALDAADLPAMLVHLAEIDVPWSRVDHPAVGLVQLNLRDPDGVKVELTFREQQDAPDPA